MSARHRWIDAAVLIGAVAALLLVPVLYVEPFIAAQFDPPEVCGKLLGGSYDALEEQYFPLPRQSCRSGVQSVDTVTPADALPAAGALLTGFACIAHLMLEGRRARGRGRGREATTLV